MPRTRIEELSPAAQRFWGVACMGVGALTAWIVNRHPENLRAPAWVAYAACATFGIAGLAIVLRPWVTRRAYAWAMVALLVVMTTIPAWIAFGPGARACRSNLPFLRGDLACRVGFGISAVVMLLVCALAVQLARRTPPDASA